MNILEKYLTYVWPKIVTFLNDNSQAKYTPQGWYGPCVWSEDGDIKRIITRFCEDYFGLTLVHNETKIAKYTFARFAEDYKKRIIKSRQRIDIDITDASSWRNNSDFMNTPHDLFIEVKGIRNNHTRYCKFGVAILVDQGDKNGKNYILNKEKEKEKLKTKYSPVVPLIWQYEKS